jgi:hypothetical protein
MLPGLGAQEGEEDTLPTGMLVSQWQCPQSAVSAISQVYDSLWVPIEQELVNEGLLFGTGMFFHQWGDEWNVNWYRLGQDRDAVFAALDEGGRRFNERHPDPPDFLLVCTAHRDNIYFWGPRTQPPPAGSP